MPRTKGFEPETALEAAMELFWSRGYESTSMRDLLDGMGIGRGSFYDTFGDKRSLFLAALDRFEETRTAWAIETLENSESALAGIEEVFERTIHNLTDHGSRRGCLMANSAVELAPRDAEIEARIARYVLRLNTAFESAVARPGERRTLHGTRRAESPGPLPGQQHPRPACPGEIRRGPGDAERRRSHNPRIPATVRLAGDNPNQPATPERRRHHRRREPLVPGSEPSHTSAPLSALILLSVAPL